MRSARSSAAMLVVAFAVALPGSAASVASASAPEPSGRLPVATIPSPGPTCAEVLAEVVGGCEAWVSRYGTPAGMADIAQHVRVSPDGTLVFVTGTADTDLLFPLGGYGGSAPPSMVTVAYEALNGQQVWAVRRAGAVATDIAVSPDGERVFVSGAFASVNDSDFLTVAYDARTGSEAWTARYAGPGGKMDGAFAIAVNPLQPEIYVTGASYAADTNYDYLTIGYSATTGAMLWSERFSGHGPGQDPPFWLAGPVASRWTLFYGRPSRGLDMPVAMAVDPAGQRVYVTGSSANAEGVLEIATVAYETAHSESRGMLRWVARHQAAGTGAAAMGMQLAPDGSRLAIVGMMCCDAGDGPDLTITAYDTDHGSAAWSSKHASGIGPTLPLFNGVAALQPLAISPNGSTVFVSGYGSNLFRRQMETLAYDLGTGQQRWLATYAAPLAPALAVHAGHSVTVTPDSTSVIVTGASFRDSANREQNDVLTLSYQATTGEQEWGARYTGAARGQDSGMSLALSPDGRSLYVTGIEQRSPTDHDYVTMAYRLPMFGGTR